MIHPQAIRFCGGSDELPRSNRLRTGHRVRIEPALDERQKYEIQGEVEFGEYPLNGGAISLETAQPLFKAVSNMIAEKLHVPVYSSNTGIRHVKIEVLHA